MTTNTNVETTREAIALLHRAKARIEKGWCQGAMARAEDHSPVSPSSAEATSWCFVGSMQAHVAPSQERVYNIASDAVNDMLPGFPYASKASFNDMPGRKKGEVVAVLESAISRLEAEVTQ